MPFTFAHPAIVLSQKNNKHLDFTSLVIGTMAPDFEYFLNFRPISTLGHTFFGQIYFNLPLILAIAYLYSNFLKIAIIENLPKSLYIRYYYLTKSKWTIDSFKRFLLVSYSALLGAFTHIFWDAFTHKHAFFVDRITFLSSNISFSKYNLPVYKILQHGSTLVGFLIIYIYLISIMDRTSKYELVKYLNCKSVSSKLKYWISSILLSAVFMGFVVLNTETLRIGSFIISFINSVLIGLLISSFIYRLYNY